MKRSKAVRVAIECMEQQKKHYSVGKNLHEKLHDNNPSSVNAYTKFMEIEEAIKILKDENG